MDPFTVGVEEEYHLVDATTGALVSRAEEVLPVAQRSLGEEVQPELISSQIEIGTPVCRSLAEVRAELDRLRGELDAAAQRRGARIAATSTHPFSSWRDQEITPEEHYLGLERDFQQLTREQLIVGCHVHVNVEDPELAVDVMNRCRPWLAPLAALAANSPFWAGVDTGYASFRTQVWRRWPVSGVPEVLASRADYDALVEGLKATGAIVGPRTVYWDLRPSAKFPTLEFRTTDVCLSVDEAVAVAGLCRGLVRTFATAAQRGAPLVAHRSELLRAAVWRAARDGLDGELVDVESVATRPAAQVVGRLLDLCRPALEEEGDWEEVSQLVERVLADGNGAARQRRALERTGRLEGVVEAVVAETNGG